MAASGEDRSGMISGINVTPLVDVMLVLLIIFMVTAKLEIAPTQALPLELPKASSGEATVEVFSVALLTDGTTRLNGAPVATDDALLPLAEAAHQRTPELRVVIQADAHVFHERVIHVMDLLSRAGVSQIAFAVSPEQGTARP